MSSRTKLVIIGVVVLGVLGYLLTSGFDAYSMHRAAIDDIVKDPLKFQNKGVKITGTVMEGTIVKTPLSAVFNVKDAEGDASMKVVYKGVVPDTFQDDVYVILEGRYNTASKQFEANKLLTKCPSRYEGMDYNEHIKATADQNAKI